MELRLWRAFLAVAEFGTFARAAEGLSISQPALTKQVQALERSLGGVLFARGRHGALLTALGMELHPGAIDLVSRAERLERRAEQITSGDVGRLNLGYGLSSIAVAPRAVAEFRRQYPKVQVKLDDMSSQVAVRRLLDGDLDAAYGRATHSSSATSLASAWVGEDRLAIASLRVPDLPLETWLASQPVVSMVQFRSPGLAAQVHGWREAVGVHLEVVQFAQDLLTVLALVAAGIGVAVVPANAAWIAPPTVRLTPIEHPASSWPVHLFWLAGAASPVVRNFVAIATAASGFH